MFYFSRWWIDGVRQREYPILSKWALNIHTIPVMSLEPERIFSGTKGTISDSRYSLSSDTMQALQCLQSWQSTTGVGDMSEPV